MVDHTQMLEATLNALAAGVFLVSRDGRVLYMNRFADAVLRAGNVLAVCKGRLTPLDREAAGNFGQMLAAGGRTGVRQTPATSTLALPRAGGGGLVATLMPLGRRPAEMPENESVTAVIVQDPEVMPHLPGAAFAELYRLTQAELRVAMAIVPGATPQAAAAKLGISCNTVKTHLQRIFEKTATSRQADLVALMMRTMPPVTV